MASDLSAEQLSEDIALKLHQFMMEEMWESLVILNSQVVRLTKLCVFSKKPGLFDTHINDIRAQVTKYEFVYRTEVLMKKIRIDQRHNTES